ncbi:class I poly(R)-hydroxyalkanoic acid synthase [Polycladidibacter stylochi]|uniref:class I poly(R)-hydroxyalkanoic acid synthase n=1 Tax=Polycladidibacter stylochi TaxID=1807766 RepID=UPI0008361ED3|nr:class I poly(R)-hydroxyalkanoic acid synthase [Pseudovibrio stylochi]
MAQDTNDNPTLQYLLQNPEEFASNLAKIAESSGKALAAYLEPREKHEVETEASAELNAMIKTLSTVAEYWLKDPSRAIEAQARLWSGYMSIWNNTLRAMAGEKIDPVIEADAKDKRFKDSEWDDNNFFNFLKQMYLQTTQWAQTLVSDAEEIDPQVKKRATFYINLITNAMSPSNFIFTNPELLRETMSQNGENLVKGMDMLAEDIKKGKGDLKIRQTDISKFETGKNLAVTPGKVIMENDICQLIQYEASTKTVYKRPLLIIPPWINKYYILDLTAEKSLIKWAVDRGHSVFIVSWVNPTEAHAQKTFEDYMQQGIFASIEKVKQATGEDTVNAMGYCVGGTLLAATLAYMAQTGQADSIASATFLTTQIDFAHAGDLKIFTDEEHIANIEQMMQSKGYLDGSKLAMTFNLLRSGDLVWPYVINNYIRGKEPFPFDLLYWNADSTRLPATNHSFYLRNCYLNNTLAEGKMVLAGEQLNINSIKTPCYQLATREDHIAPAKSVLKGAQLLGGPVDFVLSGSGHIAGVVNPPTKKKYQYWTNKPEALQKSDSIEKWLESAGEHEGSWWPHWNKWIQNHSLNRIPARTIGDNGIDILEDAPGSFVKVVS